MGIIVAFFCLLCVAAAKKYGSKLNPQTLFCGFIGFIFLASIFNYSNTTSFLTCFISILGVIGYSVGVGISFNNSNTLKYDHGEYVVNNRFVTILVSLMMTWSVYKAFTTVVPLLMMGYSLDYVRMVYFGTEVGDVSKSALEGIIEVFVNQPFLYAIMPLTALELSKPKEERQMKPLVIIMVIIWVAVSCLISGGRMLLYNFIVVIVFAFLLNNKKNIYKRARRNKSLIKKTIYALIIGGLIYLMYIFSIYRNDEQHFNAIDSLTSYFTGCVPHTSLRLSSENIEYTYGMTFLSGIARPIMLLYKYTIGAGQFPDIYQQTINIAFKLQEVVTINGGDYNAFVLPFYFFYYDGNIIGVVLESAIYGYFSGRAYFRARLFPSHISIVKYLVVCIYIFTSMVRFSPYIVSMIFAYLFVKFCYKKV